MDYRGRVLLALAFLVLAKVANVGVPLVLKDIVDALDINEHRDCCYCHCPFCWYTACCD